MEIKSKLRRLTKRQQETLAKAFIRLRKNELKSSNDKYTSQLVLSKYNTHWVCMFHQTMEDVVEGRWSMAICSIEHMMVDYIHEDVPMMTNIMPNYIIGNDGNLYEPSINDSENENDINGIIGDEDDD